MDIPPFCKEHLNPHSVPTDLGDAFQCFVAELLKRKYANLHRFPAGGKDGGIDLVAESDSLTVFECKHIGGGDFAAVRSRWKVVADNLDEHLADPTGPTSGQAQYGPWYDADRSVDRYVLCVTATLANQRQRDELRDQIRDFFHGLAASFPHLTHLGKMEVEVVDWSDFTGLLETQPHKLFRWFPGTRPSGLIPLDHPVGTSTFRGYLDEGKLPFYGLRRHLTDYPPPENAEILDEQALLDSLHARDVSGLVVYGQGDVGKTRLCLEIGRLALEQGWTVLRVTERFKLDALERLAERLTPETPALLVVDYVETQTDFMGLVEEINLLIDTWSLQIRYVASCRTGYHSRIRLLGRYRPVNVSPLQGDAAEDWFDSYRRETVRHILDACGIQPGPEHLNACHQRPVLAVFMSYLHAAGREDDLAELLCEESFERWVTKRVQLSF